MRARAWTRTRGARRSIRGDAPTPSKSLRVEGENLQDVFVFGAAFFFSRRFGNPTDRDDPVLVSHDARRDLDVRTETNLAGPIDVPLSWTIFAVKERALAAWPEPSPVFSKPAPPGPHALKLILNGRVLDNGKTLRDAKVASDAVVTCHLMVQVKLPPPSRGMAHADGKALAPGCGCVVS